MCANCANAVVCALLYSGHLQQMGTRDPEVKWDWKENEGKLLVRTSQERLVLEMGEILG